MVFADFVFVAGAGDFVRGELEFAAALAGGEGDAAVACGFEVGFAGGVFFADEGVVEGLEAGDEFAGGVVLGFVVVVALGRGGGNVSSLMLLTKGGDLGKGGTYHSKSCLVQLQFCWIM